MFNSVKEADKSKFALQAVLAREGLLRSGQEVQLAYNLDEPPLQELLQVASQKSEEYGRNFFRWLSDFSLADDAFRLLAFAASRAADHVRYVSDPDLRRQVDEYKADIAAGKTILVVAHSQGNFYANSAWHLLQGVEGATKRFFIVAAAAPVDSVAGGGPYSTLTQDRFMNAVRTALSALPANVTNSSASLSGHEFVSQYLKGDRSGPKIASEIRDTVARINDASLVVGKGELEYQDPSLWPFLRYACLLQTQAAQYTDGECIALTALDRTYAWFGVEREKRSVPALIDWIDDCEKDWWHEPGRFDFMSCSLLGDHSLFDMRGNGHSALDFVSENHQECNWRGHEVGRRTAPGAIAEAKSLLRSPPQTRSDRRY